MRIILVGKAGSGKDHFRDWLKNVEQLDVSYTTRPPREGEVAGYTYNYISRTDFLKLENSNFFLESVAFNGWHYGTSQSNWEEKGVFIMTPSGLKNIPISDRSKCIIIYFDIRESIRRKRLSTRSDADSVSRRLLADEVDFKDYNDFDIKVTKPFYNPETLYSTILTYVKI